MSYWVSANSWLCVGVSAMCWWWADECDEVQVKNGMHLKKKNTFNYLGFFMLLLEFWMGTFVAISYLAQNCE